MEKIGVWIRSAGRADTAAVPYVRNHIALYLPRGCALCAQPYNRGATPEDMENVHCIRRVERNSIHAESLRWSLRRKTVRAGYESAEADKGFQTVHGIGG